ncbi:MAG TPA: DUF2232 domain-containing protein [Gemmatimonadales bacterium]|nr:DUF2232 domain-containing protein [Gemmatimonadales bacterium]
MEPGTLLLVPALACCALAGWWAGGRVLLAVAWIGLAVWVGFRTADGASSFTLLALGWSVLVSALFGIVTLVGGMQHFLPRALVSIGLALAAALALQISSQLPAERITGVIEREYRDRVEEWAASADRVLAAPEWRSYVADNPSSEQLMAQAEAQLRTLPRPSSLLFPAFLALQTLAAFGLTWALYHRISRTRLGPPLSPLRELRFSDQLVWGLIVGITLSVLPSLAELRLLGLNLLLFFGALYLLRGLGVLSWYLNPGRAMTALLLVISVILWPFVGATALTIGLVDTWADWRRRARPTP